MSVEVDVLVVEVARVLVVVVFSVACSVKVSVVLTLAPATVEVLRNVLVVSVVIVSAGAVIVLSRETVSVEVVSSVVVAVHLGKFVSVMWMTCAAPVDEGAVSLRLKRGAARPDSLYIAWIGVKSAGAAIVLVVGAASTTVFSTMVLTSVMTSLTVSTTTMVVVVLNVLITPFAVSVTTAVSKTVEMVVEGSAVMVVVPVSVMAVYSTLVAVQRTPPSDPTQSPQLCFFVELGAPFVVDASFPVEAFVVLDFPGPSCVFEVVEVGLLGPPWPGLSSSPG